MLSLFKIWAAANIESQWTQDMENYIMIKKPTTHAELEEAIREYQDKQQNKK